MKIIYQRDKEPEEEGDLFVAGSCLGLETKESILRIPLTQSQWWALADSARDRAAARYSSRNELDQARQNALEEAIISFGEDDDKWSRREIVAILRRLQLPKGTPILAAKER